MAKYEIWGRTEFGRGKRQRLAYGFTDEKDAREALQRLKAEGYKDSIIAQRPPTYGHVSGVQREGEGN